MNVLSGIAGRVHHATLAGKLGAGFALAVAEMDTVTQQNAALVQQSASAAASLDEQAVNLERTVSVFRLGNEAL
ncbi:hypothetical protein RABR111495_17840 [Rahnella bruchi]|uniref:hypothetical protein n=1 Tax=Rahnella bruchi TaxID=1510573 RepID=UPI000EA18BE7|nr:hypothetical protein [Rahnella bruchi]